MDATDLDALIVPGAPPFALLRRQSMATAHIEILVGEMVELQTIAELPRSTQASLTNVHDLLVVIPYRQVAERGFDCVDDKAPLLAMRIQDQGIISVHEALSKLPADKVTLLNSQFDINEQVYADTARRVLAEEIGKGTGANFVIKRSFLANLADSSPRTALTLFAKLLTIEQGAYWTFVIHTGKQTIIGASPERHVSLSAGEVAMSPISGTYRYPSTGPTLNGMLKFLSDGKETDELYMVLDEELKMMARICSGGGRVIGPQLREMAHLAHTEYLLKGESNLDARDILRETLLAPTVTGSPVESACRVIRRYEPEGRGYYSGVLAVIGRDETGEQAMDSTILIRTAEIDENGRLRLSAGATLVRHSDPDTEALETRAKLEGFLSAFGYGERRDVNVVNRSDTQLGQHPLVRQALDQRNETLAPFWLERQRRMTPAAPELKGRSVLVIDAEDTFTAMLRHQLMSLGMVVTVRRFDEVYDPHNYDFVVLGPGPGDPRSLDDPKINSLRVTAVKLLRERRPFLAVCLGHQIISSILGLPLVRKSTPNQGAQLAINYFGCAKTVGFYNTFAALAVTDRLYCELEPRGTEICRDDATGEVHALRGQTFYSTQFHPESVLSPDGLGILRDLFCSFTRTNPMER